MALSLLEKTRKLNNIIRELGTKPIDLCHFCQVLAGLLDCSIFVSSNKGKILAYDLNIYFSDAMEDSILKKGRLPQAYNSELNEIKDTLTNTVQDNFSLFTDKEESKVKAILLTVVPIKSGTKRLGTMLFIRQKEGFTDEDMVMVEYSSTMVGMELARVTNSQIEQQARRISVVRLALATLSYSEMEAIVHIFSELEGQEGLLVAGKIADRVGITRSVIVNALRKLESAGVIESRSLGMKGTFIKILNDKLMEELEKIG